MCIRDRKYLNQAEEVFDEVENDSVMQKLWEAYRKKFSYASDLEWEDVYKRQVWKNE